MKLHDFENDPHHATELPVNYEADAVDSTSPAALPTCAPATLLAPTRAELHARWQGDPRFDLANRAWHELLNHLAAFYPHPATN